MADAEGVVLALRPRREGREAVGLLDGVQAIAAPRQHLVRVGLMADVPDQPVMRRVVDIMQRDGELHRAQAGREMAATGADGVDQELAQLLRHLRQFRHRQLAQVGG